MTALDNSPAPCSITQEALMGSHLAEGSTSRPRTPLQHQNGREVKQLFHLLSVTGDENNHICNRVSLTRSKKRANFLNSFLFYLSFFPFCFHTRPSMFLSPHHHHSAAPDSHKLQVIHLRAGGGGVKSQPCNCATPVLHRGRVTRYLVLF